MNRTEALQSLQDSSATTRLRAARVLLEHGLADDLDQLRAARLSETDSWTQKVLDRGIHRLTTGVRVIETEPASIGSQEGIAAAQSQALQIATKRVLHEVRPVLQSIGRAVKKDIGDGYEETATYGAVVRMSDLLDALQDLGEAAQSPRQTQFDLTELVSAQIKSEGFADRTVLARSDPMLVEGDPTLVALAFVNLARNAIDASAATKAVVIINWGRNDSVAWISVLDEGEGLPPDGLSAAFDVGTTTRTRSGHFGLGLPIASQAMRSLGGEIVLQPRREKGTAAEARWPQ